MARTALYLVLALLAAASAAPGTRVYGGQHTTIEEKPYMVALTYLYPGAGITIQRCVGTLVSSWHVITSAYCFTGSIQTNFNARAGSTNSLSGGTLVAIREIVKHPEYVETPRAHDISVLHLERALGISNVINVLYLPPQNSYIADGQEVRAVSWGFDDWPGGTQLETLKTVTLYKLPLEECREAYADSDEVEITDPVICAMGPEQGMCFGDDGASIAMDSVLVGTHSYRSSCTSDGYPDVFARVDRYTNWILEVAAAGRSGPGLRTAPLVIEA